MTGEQTPAIAPNITTRASRINLGLNAFLFSIKISAGIMSGSLAVISDALNSFSDIISSFITYVAIKLGQKGADADHPFGHARAEPLAGLVIAIFAGILSFEILKTSLVNIFSAQEAPEGGFALIALTIGIIAKIFMSWQFGRIGRQANSPALRATSIDCRNDVLASSVAFLGYFLSQTALPALDDLSAMLIALWIGYSGYRMGMENVQFLMGNCPSATEHEHMKEIALATPGVVGVNEIKAHYIGNKIQVEIHIELDSSLPFRQAHDIGNQVKYALQATEAINSAFVHIDPVDPVKS
ncbi:MAG TPA: cation diffusion facilitator family transporter [bacterium]|nr:cation diffusion facilitator family transporter [bacterium]